jgi:hypothetical protein
MELFRHFVFFFFIIEKKKKLFDTLKSVSTFQKFQDEVMNCDKKYKTLHEGAGVLIHYLFSGI